MMKWIMSLRRPVSTETSGKSMIFLLVASGLMNRLIDFENYSYSKPVLAADVQNVPIGTLAFIIEVAI